MWVTRRLSCCRTWRRQLPAKSSMSTAASATSWPAWALFLLRSQRRLPDLDVGPRAQRGDIRLELRRAIHLADALRRLRVGNLAIHVDHLRDAQHQVAVGER